MSSAKSDELDGGPVNVELVVIERAHPPIVAVSGTGTGTSTDIGIRVTAYEIGAIKPVAALGGSASKG